MVSLPTGLSLQLLLLLLLLFLASCARRAQNLAHAFARSFSGLFAAIYSSSLVVHTTHGSSRHIMLSACAGARVSFDKYAAKFGLIRYN